MVAALGAAVTIAHLAGIPVADDLSNVLLGVFDAVAAALVVIVPNR